MSPPLTYLTSVGALVIESLTVVCSGYLVWSLSKQGWGKVRVRLLIGMVISDLMLGIVTIIPNIMYQTGAGLKTGSSGCNATAFLVVAILFTQHLWTLVIAISTYLLLRHPLSPWATRLEKHAFVMPFAIWAISLIHSGIWWSQVGFSSSGYVCYYKSQPLGSVDGKDLVQFIPRAIVFVVVFCLYSRLFSFLRRPDTIQLSSPHVEVVPAKPISCPAKAKRAAKRMLTTRSRSTPATTGEIPPWEKLEIAYYETGTSTPISFDTKLATPSSSMSLPDRKLSTVSSQDDRKHTLSVTLQMPEETEEEEEEEEDGSQTLTEFFKENQVNDGQASRLQGSFSTTEGDMEMSAATYLNRQASLLMLWFPLAYLVVFGASLVRLIYDMVADKPSPVLLLISLWFVLSVGLIDFVVFGLAELVVRRRVRRKIPTMAP